MATAKKLAHLVRQRLKAHLESLETPPTQTAIGHALGKDQTFVSKYLLERVDMDIDTLDRWCAFFQIDVGKLVSETAKDIRHDMPDTMLEAITLLQGMTDDERKQLMGGLRLMARRHTPKKARPKRKSTRA